MKIRQFDWLLFRLVPWLGSRWLKFLGFSMRLECRGIEQVTTLSNQGKNIIFAFWHGRQLMLPITYQMHRKGRKMAVLISQHRDGEFISRTIKYFGLDSARGSTYRGAVRGLKRLVGLLNQGMDVGITPDGPRGPKYKAQPGAVELAKLSGMPIVPATFGAVKKKLSPVGII